jgi:hypothetical protein
LFAFRTGVGFRFRRVGKLLDPVQVAFRSGTPSRGYTQ